MMYFFGALLVLLLILSFLILGFVVGHDDGTRNDNVGAAGSVMADPKGWSYSQVNDASGTLRPGPSRAHTRRIDPTALARQLTPRPWHVRGQGAGTRGMGGLVPRLRG
jgi:hypothetical protein